MRKKVTILIFLLLYIVSFAQSEEIYLNDDFELISKEEFLKETNYPSDYNLKFKSDTTYVNVKVKRHKEGKIPMDIFNSIKETLETSTRKKIDSNDVFFINYYPGNGPCSSNGYKDNFRIMYNSFYKKFAKIENIKQFSIYSSSKKPKRFGSKIQWTPDVNNLIKSTFFPIHYPCGGYVAIKNDGTYISQRGEYCYSEKLIREIKTFANIGSSQITGD